MSFFPCKNFTICAPGTEAEFAATRNFSAENPDLATFFSQWQCDRTGVNPPFNLCQSIKSQEQSDWCAAWCFPEGVFPNTDQTCSGPCGSYTAPAEMFHSTSVAAANKLAHDYACAAVAAGCLLGNTAQSCTVQCGDSSFRTYTVPANTFRGPSVASLNQLAANLACNIAAAMCLGTLFPSAAQSCSVVCPATGGTLTINLPAGVVLAFSQSEANSQAHALACALAALACPLLPPLVPNTAQTCSQLCNGTTITYTVPAGAFVGVDQNSANSTAFVFACLTLSTACQTQQFPPPAMNAASDAQTCSITCPGGGTFSKTIPYGAFRSVNVAAANAAALSYCQAHITAESFCLDSIQTFVCADEVFASFVSTNPNLVFVLTSGALPSGIRFSQGVLAGIPTFPGIYSFTITAQDGSGNYATRDYTINVGGITNSTLPDGETGTAYSQFISSGGFSDPGYFISGGSLPTGLSLNPTSGQIFGTPLSSGTFDFTVSVEQNV